MDELGTGAKMRPHDQAAQAPSNGRSLTNRSLHERSARLSEHLRKMGTLGGRCVGLLTEAETTALEARWAARRAGLDCILVPTSDADEVRALLERHAVRVLFADSKHRAWIDSLAMGRDGHPEVMYVDGIASREIADGYEWIASIGEIPAHLRIDADAGARA